MNKKFSFNGGTVILSGASGGLGRALTALLIKKYCCRVIGIGRNEEKLSVLREMYGESFSYYIFDVSQKQEWNRFAQKLKENGENPNILINNAGILPNFESFESGGADETEKTMKINFFSCVYSAEALISILKNGGKRAAIVNVSSSRAMCPLTGTSGYSASKGALKNFTQALAEEQRGKMLVSLVMPGFCKTEIFRNQKHGEDLKFVEIAATDPRRAAKRMLALVSRGKRRIIIGWDAVLMSFFTKIFPSFSLRVYAWVLKISGLELFKDVFK